MSDTCKLDQNMLLSRQLAMGLSQLQAAAGHTYLLMIHKPSSCLTQFAQLFPALFTHPAGLITSCSEAESALLLCPDRSCKENMQRADLLCQYPAHQGLQLGGLSHALHSAVPVVHSAKQTH